MNQDTKGLMYMFTILFLNQKGGVGKTTLADELAFALELPRLHGGVRLHRPARGGFRPRGLR